MRIDFDYTNLLSGMVGEAHGVTPEELKRTDAAATAALAAVRKRFDDGEIGFPALPEAAQVVDETAAYAGSVVGRFDTICVAGIGGSALGCWALDCGLRGPHPVQREHSKSNSRMVILDNVDPSFIESALESMKAKKTLLVVIGKSGGTAETMAVFMIVKDWLESHLGKKADKHIAIVTSEQRGEIKALALRKGYPTFHIPENVGGRFSVLSPVGLLPAALIGVDIRKLVKGAADMTKLCWSSKPAENIALRAAQLHHVLLTKKGKAIQVSFPYSNRLYATAFWFRQLWAESLGKAHDRAGKLVNVGQTPVAALGTTDQHSQVQLYAEGPNDKVFVFWGVGKFPTPGKIPKTKYGMDAYDYLGGKTLEKLLAAEQKSTACTLTKVDRPNCTFTLDKMDAEHLGAFLQMMMFETAFAGEMLGIDAFDQPGVEQGKKYTFAMMGRKGYDEFGAEYAAYEAKRVALKK